jgi:AAA family ATP:ADP antiporter
MFIILYSKAANTLSKTGLFYATLIPFFVFYLVFAWVLFPNRDVIHFPTLGEGLGLDGTAAGAAVKLVRYWSFSLFFIVSELWASAGVPLLFWQVSAKSDHCKTASFVLFRRNSHCLSP